MNKDEQLDQIYHALPEWARVLEGRTLPQNIEYRFNEVLTKWEEAMRKIDSLREERNQIIDFAARELEVSFSDFYWKYLQSKKSHECK